jgi:hypothetical protein
VSRASRVALITGTLVFAVGAGFGVRWSEVLHALGILAWPAWCLLAGVLVVSAVLLQLSWARYRRASEATWGWTVVLIVVPVLVLTTLSLVILFLSVDASNPADRIDVIKTALSVGAGTGGIAALVLGGRRQWATERAHRDVTAHQEKVADATKADATARRITELYAKSSEQLGSDKAPVRLAGLYALERLAEENVDQRQKIVSVLCAYLRMPYVRPDSDTPTTGASKEERDLFEQRAQEKEVRLTAQKIICDHLRPDGDSGSFWGELDLDFTGATLIEFNLGYCHVHSVKFDHANLYVTARFGHATLRRALFMRTTFHTIASFESTVFDGITLFTNAKFQAPATFTSAQFCGLGDFRDAIFFSKVNFKGSNFGDMGLEDAWVKDSDPRLPLSRHEWPNKFKVRSTVESPTGEQEGGWGRVVRE